MSAAAPEPVELYEGTVRHRRRAPTRHAFTYRVAFLHLDLDRLDPRLEVPRVRDAGQAVESPRR